DRVYLEYRPGSWLAIAAGKMPNPTFDRELLWDGDVSPEGLAEHVTLKHGNVKGTASAAQLVLADFDETSADPWLYIGQLRGELSLTNIELEAGIAYYHYTNLDVLPLPYAQGTNSHDADDVLTSDYHILVALAAIAIETPWKPVSAHVELSNN